MHVVQHSTPNYYSARMRNRYSNALWIRAYEQTDSQFAKQSNGKQRANHKGCLPCVCVPLQRIRFIHAHTHASTDVRVFEVKRNRLLSSSARKSPDLKIMNTIGILASCKHDRTVKCSEKLAWFCFKSTTRARIATKWCALCWPRLSTTPMVDCAFCSCAQLQHK